MGETSPPPIQGGPRRGCSGGAGGFRRPRSHRGRCGTGLGGGGRVEGELRPPWSKTKEPDPQGKDMPQKRVSGRRKFQ